MSEALFQNWCTLNGVQPVPMPPQLVAQFVADIAPLGIDKVWPAVQEVSRLHYTVGLADPTAGFPVMAVVNEIAKMPPPESWPKEHWKSFYRLPRDLQEFVTEHERRRRLVVVKAMEVAARAREQAGLPKLPKNYYRDAHRRDQKNENSKEH